MTYLLGMSRSLIVNVKMHKWLAHIQGKKKGMEEGDYLTFCCVSQSKWRSILAHTCHVTRGGRKRETTYLSGVEKLYHGCRNSQVVSQYPKNNGRGKYLTFCCEITVEVAI